MTMGIVGGGGGLVTLAVLVFLWVRWRHRTSLELTERFGKASTELGAPAVERRLDAVLELDQIARTRRSFRGPVDERLAAFVRTRRPREAVRPYVDEDVRVALRVLIRRGRGEWLQRGKHVDLCGTNLCGVDFARGDLRDANLADCRLGSDDPLVRGACFQHADLRGASLRESVCNWTNFWRADLARADLSESKLGSTTLNRANLARANLSAADLRGAQLHEANLAGAILWGADLSTAQGLTAPQLAVAQVDDQTRLPPHASFAERVLHHDRRYAQARSGVLRRLREAVPRRS